MILLLMGWSVISHLMLLSMFLGQNILKAIYGADFSLKLTIY
jgi:hypothetical protein